MEDHSLKTHQQPQSQLLFISIKNKDTYTLLSELFTENLSLIQEFTPIIQSTTNIEKLLAYLLNLENNEYLVSKLTLL